METIFITAKERTNFKNWVVILRFYIKKKLALKIFLPKPDQIQTLFGAGQCGVKPSKIVFIRAFGKIGLLDKNIFPLATLGLMTGDGIGIFNL